MEPVPPLDPRMEDVTLRDWIATAALQGLLAQSTGEDAGWTPTWEDADFEPINATDGWEKNAGKYWRYTNSSSKAQKHKLIRTYHQATAREAYRLADAMLQERAK
jgi:hypothetical protein